MIEGNVWLSCFSIMFLEGVGGFLLVRNGDVYGTTLCCWVFVLLMFVTT